jgi:ATP-binding cassette subfamily B protein
MDRICVFDGGTVIEDGTHDELMAAAGRYHAMFRAQAAPFTTPGDVR